MNFLSLDRGPSLALFLPFFLSSEKERWWKEEKEEKEKWIKKRNGKVEEVDQEKEELSPARQAAGQDGGGRWRGLKVGEKQEASG